MSALRDKYKLKQEWTCSQVGDKVRICGRWLLKTAKDGDAGAGENLSEGDHESADLHLPSSAYVQEQPGGWHPTKEDVGKDRPSLKAVKTQESQERGRRDSGVCICRQ
eukprot:6491818-Amphidinium_carterae.2